MRVPSDPISIPPVDNLRTQLWRTSDLGNGSGVLINYFRHTRRVADGSAGKLEANRMLLLVVGLAIFFLIHLLPTLARSQARPDRAVRRDRLQIAFSVVSLIGFALIVYGYGKLHLTPGKVPAIWSPPLGLKHLTMLLMWPAFILLVAAYIPSRIRTAVKHPMLAL